MLVRIQELGNGVGCVSLDQLQLGDVAEEPIRVVDFDQFQQLLLRIRVEIALLERRQRGRVFLRQLWKTLKSIEAIDASDEVHRLKDGADVCPRHQTSSTKYSAFNDRPLDPEDALEDLILSQESREVLAFDILWKAFDLLFPRIWRPFKNSLKATSHQLLFVSSETSFQCGARLLIKQFAH